MTLNEASFNLLNSLSGGRSTDNEFRSLEQIKFTILYYRALFGRRELAKRNRSYEMEQTLWLVPVEAVEPRELSVPANFTGVYATNELPKLLRMKEGSGLVYVQNGESGINIAQVDQNAVEMMRYSRYTGMKPRAFEMDGRLGFVYHDGTAVTIRGVFEDPRAAHNFNQVQIEGEDFWDDDKHSLPLPMDLYAQITEGVLSKELQLMTTTQSDLLANQVPDAAQ